MSAPIIFCWLAVPHTLSVSHMVGLWSSKARLVAEGRVVVDYHADRRWDIGDKAAKQCELVIVAHDGWEQDPHIGHAQMWAAANHIRVRVMDPHLWVERQTCPAVRSAPKRPRRRSK